MTQRDMLVSEMDAINKFMMENDNLPEAVASVLDAAWHKRYDQLGGILRNSYAMSNDEAEEWIIENVMAPSW